MWRLSWSDDQYEKRITKFTPAGIELLEPMEIELPKYQWIQARWVLENLVIVPELQQIELCGVKTSYEPIWAFANNEGIPVEPSFTACKVIIDTVYAAKGKESLAPKYVDSLSDPKITEEVKKAEVDKLVEELFGDESFLMGRTITGEAIAMPQSYKSHKND